MRNDSNYEGSMEMEGVERTWKRYYALLLISVMEILKLLLILMVMV